MGKIIYNKFDKKLITKLPRVMFEGTTIVVVSDFEARKAVDFLLNQPLLGIDTETRPSFKKGKQNIVSLLQVATKNICFLFRLNYIGLSDNIRRLLEDTTVPKVGLSLHDDVLSLHKRGDFTPGLFIDLQDHMKELGVDDKSLQKLYAIFFGQKISKSQQLSNWEADVLSDKQKSYAATDAWACVMLYEEYLRLRSTGDFTLEIVEEKEEEHLEPQS
jgi:ribonuclease D